MNESLQLFSMEPGLEIADSTNIRGQFGCYLQNHSRLKVRLIYPIPEGNDAERVVLTCGGLTGIGEELEFSLPNAGTVTVTGTVTYADGTAAQASTTVNVTAYAVPAVTISALERCDAWGNADSEGSYGKVTFRSSQTGLPGTTSDYSLQYKARTSQNWETMALENYRNAGSLENGQAIFPADVSRDYQVRLRLADPLHLSVSREEILCVAFALADFCKDNHALALGMRAGSRDTLSIGLPVDMHSNPIGGLPEPAEDSQAVNLGYCRRSFWGPVQLWENPSPTAAYASGAVNLNLAAYRFFAIEFISGGNTYVQLGIKGAAGVLMAQGSGGLESRPFRISDSGVSFFACSDSTRMIPTKIYGL